MPDAVQTVKRQTVLFAERFQPLVGHTVEHRLAGVLGEQPVRIHPFAAHSLCLFVLRCFVFFQHIHDRLRELHRTLRAFRLGGVRIEPYARYIIRCSTYPDDIMLKVHIFPFQPHELAPAESAVDRQHKEHPVLQRLAVDQRKQLSDLVNGVYLLLLVF